MDIRTCVHTYVHMYMVHNMYVVCCSSCMHMYLRMYVRMILLTYACTVVMKLCSAKKRQMTMNALRTKNL